MSVTIGSRPNQFSALGNPTIYKLQREDFVLSSIEDSFGLARIVISGDVSASFAVNDRLYIGATGYNKTVKVVNVTLSGGDTKIVTTAIYNGSASGYVNNFNLRPLHHVLVTFYDANDLPYFDTLAFRFATDESGVAIVDAQILRNLILENLIELDFTFASSYLKEDESKSLIFYISYEEVWSIGTDSGDSDSSNQFEGFLSALQIPNDNDLKKYVLRPFSSGDSFPKLLPSTFNNKFVAWEGWPFYVSVYKDDSDDYTIKRNGSTEGNLDVDYHCVKLCLKVEDVSFNNFQILDGSDVLTEFTLEVRSNFCGSGEENIMLVGRDALGGIVMWLFDSGQRFETRNEDGQKLLEITCGTYGLTEDQFEALYQAFTPATLVVDTDYQDMSIAKGTRTYENKSVFILSQDGETKTQVVITAFKGERSSQSVGGYFEVTIQLPYGQDI